MFLGCVGQSCEISVILEVIVRRVLAHVRFAARHRFGAAHGVIEQPSGTPGDRSACAQARVPLPPSVKINGICESVMGVAVGVDVSLCPIFEQRSAHEPLGFEGGQAETTGEAVGLALSGTESFWTGLESVVDVVGESAEVTGIDGGSGRDVWLLLPAAFLWSWGFGVIVIWLVEGFDGLDFVGRVAVRAFGGWGFCFEDDGSVGIALWAFEDVHAPCALLVCGVVGVHGAWIRCASGGSSDSRHGNALCADFGERFDIIVGECSHERNHGHPRRKGLLSPITARFFPLLIGKSFD